MKWVLFFWIYTSGSSGGNVLINQEFETQEKCEIVGKWMVSKARKDAYSANTEYACFATK